jgi:hypothetical protein
MVAAKAGVRPPDPEMMERFQQAIERAEREARYKA